MTKKKEKIRQRRYIEKGTKLEAKDKDSKNKIQKISKIVNFVLDLTI